MGALDGIRVIELGQIVAAPFCGALLADFGAEVIKVEIPGVGDNLRKMGPIVDGRSPWFAVENRNKKCITLNLKQEKGKKIFVELIKKADVITENFKPGVLDKLGFSWDEIRKINPRVVFVRISGYGQTGPYKDRYGYDRIGLGMGGLTYITGFPESAPLRPGVSLADYLCGYAAAMGVLTALYNRDISGTGVGQELDLGLYEPIFRIMEFTPLNYSLTKTVRERIGNAFPGTVPSGHFQTRDGKWMSLAVGNDRLFERFARCVDRVDLLGRPEFANHELRVKNRTELDQIAEEWIAGHTSEECFAILGEDVPVGPIHAISDIFEDPHYLARNNIVEVNDPHWGNVKLQGVVPKMSGTPGEVKWIGPDLGQHNAEVYGGLLGFSPEDIDRLTGEGVI
jgi:formyl-CoA transferase